MSKSNSPPSPRHSMMYTLLCATLPAYFAPAIMSLMLFSTTGCAAYTSQVNNPLLPHTALQASNPMGISPNTWSAFLDVTSACGEWSAAAQSYAENVQGRQAKAGAVSTIAGLLATIAGATGGAIAATTDNETLPAISGTVALSFGLVALAGGVYGGSKTETANLANTVSRNIERAISQRAFEALAHDAVNSDGEVKDAGAYLALDCARYARMLKPLAKLPLSISASLGSRAVAQILRVTADEPRTTTMERIRNQSFKQGDVQ